MLNTGIPSYLRKLKNKKTSNVLSSSLLSKTKQNSWLNKHFSTTNILADTWWAHIPIGNGYFNTFALGKFISASNTSRHLGRMMLGLIGAYTHHTSGVKVGTWLSSTFDFTLGGNQAYSLTAGDTITFNTIGHTAVARLSKITNGGFSIVSIDGDYTKANRLPKFTNADLANGLCRTTDVGKCYVNSGASGANNPDCHVPLFEDLEDISHTITFETTGTKPTYSTGVRSYIGGVSGCSALNMSSNPNGSTIVINHIEIVQDFGTHGASAMIYTPEIEKTVTNTWEFLGEVHSGETDVLWLVEVDGVDKTSILANEYVAGSIIRFIKITTLANTDATSTPIAKKKQNIVFSAYQDTPCIVDWSCEWLIDKRVRSSYPLMLPIGLIEGNSKKQDRWTSFKFGEYTTIETDITTNNDAMHGFVEAYSVEISSGLHNRKAFAAMLDGGKGINYFSLSAPSFVATHDRADRYDKIYFFRSTQQNIERFSVGDKISGKVGFGIKIC